MKNKNISAELKELRTKNGLKAHQVAAKMGKGYAPTKIYEIEAGRKSVGLGMIESFANACGYDIEIVFTPQEK